MKSKIAIKTPLSLSALALALAFFSPIASASDGCKALMCFAGGKSVSECQSTIRDVLKDLSMGKPFPHCELVGDDKNPISVKTRKKNGKVKSVTINISEKYAQDPASRTQRYNF